jgi:hypothetical protein
MALLYTSLDTSGVLCLGMPPRIPLRTRGSRATRAQQLADQIQNCIA